MSDSFYDVVVLGRSLAPMLGATLLARRGFRVLVVGQGDLDARYTIGERTLPRAPFRFLPATSPVVAKVFGELAMYQAIKRRLIAPAPPTQVVLPKHRLALVDAAEHRDRELSREFPGVKRPITDFYREVERCMAGLDRLAERERAWPPESFFERREVARAAERARWGQRGENWDPLSEFADEHPFRHVVRVPAEFASDLDPQQLAGTGLARLAGQLAQAETVLEGGAAWLESSLADRFATYSGEVRPRERVARVLARRGQVEGIELAGTGERISCNFVLAGCPVDELLDLLPDRSIFEEVFERVGEPRPRFYRYSLNVVLSSEGVPPGMGRDTYVIRGVDRLAGAHERLRVETSEDDGSGERRMCVEALLPRRGIEEVPGYVEGVRERVLDVLREVVPFLDEHLRFVDSPHDGRDGHDVRAGVWVPPDKPWSRGPAGMRPVHGYPVLGHLGVCALPQRTPLRRLFLCNDQVMPGLGLEGSFLTAWTVADKLSRADRKKDWMRRGIFAKVDL